MQPNRAFIEGARIIEIGSYDVNGTVRTIFTGAAEYVGVDLTPGPGVDLVGFGHEVDHATASYDVAISGECFEHDPFWIRTLSNMVRLTRPGGLVAFTCASRGRVEHGTRRAGAHYSPGTQSAGIDYYRNVHLEDLQNLPLDQWFSNYGVWYLESSFDLYFAGVRSGSEPDAVIPDSEQVQHLSALTSRPLRIMRWPLRIAARLVRDRDRYQSFGRPYWRMTTYVGDLVLGILDRIAPHGETKGG